MDAGGTGVLIRDASLLDGRNVDVLIEHGRITRVGKGMTVEAVRVIEAKGGLLIPGLHDHHLHVAAMAAALASVRCGPPDVVTAGDLARALSVVGIGWLRGVGYHENVAGMIDRHWLDAVVPDRPVRIQHRSGRMWVLNSAGLDMLLSAAEASPPPGLEREEGQWTGRLFDEDVWLRATLGGTPPPFADVGASLARHGVTGITEMSPANGDAMAAHFAAERNSGALPQHVLLGGSLSLGQTPMPAGVTLGPVKLHLHEHHLPSFAEVVATICAAHDCGRYVAVHCVTEVELVFTLAALREVGMMKGDRIEHASVTPDDALEEIGQMDLAVVAQPNFVAERGDAYRTAIPEADLHSLYRLRSFRSAGVVLAGGSDAPFGRADPWAAMQAAVTRRTHDGFLLGTEESLTPQEALELFLADPLDLGRTREIGPGEAADLCLLKAPWRIAQSDLSAALVSSTLIGGRVVHDGVDQTPL